MKQVNDRLLRDGVEILVEVFSAPGAHREKWLDGMTTALLHTTTIEQRLRTGQAIIAETFTAGGDIDQMIALYSNLYAIREGIEWIVRELTDVEKELVREKAVVRLFGEKNG